jgi:carbamoyl-phosphate synthase large subunit
VSKVRILVTGAGGAAASNFVNALAFSDKEYFVVGSDSNRYHLELANAEKRYVVPTVDSAGYLDSINRIIEEEEIDFLHPQPDPEVRLLAAKKGEIAARTFLPNIEIIDLCQDKLALNHALVDAGVPAPASIRLQTEDDLNNALTTMLAEYQRVWLRATTGAGARASLPITDLVQGRGWIGYWQERGLQLHDFMASEFLPGAEFAWQSLWFDGGLITSQARERIEYIFGHVSPSGQTSSPAVARTVTDPAVNEIATAAVRAVTKRPHGVFCVDLKQASDGQPRVTEINAGRFFTTSNFFAHAGLNMPSMYVELGMGRTIQSAPPKYDPLPPDLYWVRTVDMGYKLVKADGWTSQQI